MSAPSERSYSHLSSERQVIEMAGVIVVGVIVLVIYLAGRSDGKQKVRDEIDKALSGKRKGRM